MLLSWALLLCLSRVIRDQPIRYHERPSIGITPYSRGLGQHPGNKTTHTTPPFSSGAAKPIWDQFLDGEEVCRFKDSVRT